MNGLPRAWIWLQLAIAWLPMWVVFTALIMSAHDVRLAPAMVGSARMVLPGALLGLGVYAFIRRVPWPHPFRLRFLGLQVIAALVYAGLWLACVLLIDHALTHRVVMGRGPGLIAFLMAGIWLYLVVAGAAYANSAAQRTAQLQAQAAKAQLAQLRAQLHPHFLFNTLHAVVQLIPQAPRLAAQAAEELAGVLRSVIEEDRDLLPLADELAFVERYLAVESLRFGERLQLRREIENAALGALVPAFALHTLVENAVRHGAAAKIGATTLRLHAAVAGERLALTVSDDGVGAPPEALRQGRGTGLRRLRERLHWQYGDSAQLLIDSTPGAGFAATLRLPLQRETAE